LRSKSCLILENYRPNFDANKCKTILLLDVILYLSVASALFVYLPLILVLVYDPAGAIFIGDLIPTAYFVFPIRLIVILFHGYLILVVHLVMISLGNAAWVYLWYITPIYTKELRIGRGNHKMEDTLRNPKNIRHIFRCLQVLHANIFCVLGLVILVCNASFMLTSIYCNFVLIRYWDELQGFSKMQFLNWSVIFVWSWQFILEFGRYISSKGGKVLASWKGNKWGSMRENRVMERFHRSCKPIVLAYGNHFVIGRLSILRYFRGITRGTFRALLTTKK